MATHAPLETQYEALLAQILEIGATHFDQGNLNEALRLLAYGMHIAETAASRRVDYGRIIVAYGKLLAWRAYLLLDGDYGPALITLERGEGIGREVEAHDLIAQALDERGLALYHRALGSDDNELDEAEAAFHAALAEWEAVGDIQGATRARLHLALIAERQGDSERAGALYREVRDQAERHGWLGELAESWRHLGFASARSGDLPAARGALERALTLLNASGQRLFLPFAHIAMAGVWGAEGAWANALDHLTTAHAEAEAMRLWRPLITSLFSLGECWEAQGDPEQAQQWYRRAARLAERFGFAQALELAQAKLEALGIDDATPSLAPE